MSKSRSLFQAPSPPTSIRNARIKLSCHRYGLYSVDMGRTLLTAVSFIAPVSLAVRPHELELYSESISSQFLNTSQRECVRGALCKRPAKIISSLQRRP